MDYLSLDIRLGLAGSRKISDQRTAFHDKLVKLAFSVKADVYRIGSPRVSPFNYDRINNEPGYIADIISRSLKEIFGQQRTSVDALLVDLSSNRFDLLRDPIIIHLVEAVEVICSKQICERFIIILPELPGWYSASIQRLVSASRNNPSMRVFVIGMSGDHYELPTPLKLQATFKGRLAQIIKEKMDEPASQFEHKIVRRLGHFRRGRHEGGCRMFSYLSDNCDRELLELIKDWWAKHELKCSAILYDTRNNPSLTIAVKAFCEYQGLTFYRIQDVITNTSVAEAAKAAQPCLLIVDVIETGQTLLNHITALNKVGVTPHRNILAAIIKGSNRETVVADYYRISSFAIRELDTNSVPCLQCQLRLPHSSDDEESFDTLRAFDMWFMANRTGWGEETDVPDNIGYGYEAVPRFDRILEEYGDWIAYKIERLYRREIHPENIFIIHPEETGAIAISDKLRLRFNNLSIVMIPRSAIRLAQSLNNSWEEALNRLDTEEWMRQLESLSLASAFITDIFNASGSTFQSILQLLRHYHISAFCYFPFVDRDCGPESAHKYAPVKKLSLYQWYGPRELRKEN
jgi:hypothetical protein